MEHPYGALSLLPPLAAIVLAIVTRRPLPSLLAGVFVGALVLAGGNPIAAVGQALEYHLWRTLIEPDKLAVFAFTTLMGGMSGIVQANGGMHALVAASVRFTSTRRRGMALTWLLGLVIFFDDYANTILLGQTMRPVADRLRISREKLAYLVDSTSAPVAGLALVSTWIAGELQYIDEGLSAVGWRGEISGVEAFLQSVPYRFYVLLSLFLCLIVALWNRDFPSMHAAERRAQELPPREPISNPDPESEFLSKAEVAAAAHEQPHPAKARWYHAIVPIGVAVVVILYQMVVTGIANCRASGEPLTLMNIFGACDSYRSLLWGSVAGIGIAALWTWASRLLPWDRIVAAAGEGAKLTLPALLALWLAGSIANMTKNEPLEPAGGFTAREVAAAEEGDRFAYSGRSLYTGRYLENLLDWIVGGRQNAGSVAWALPTIVFLAAAAMSFATGTSWGTMALLMPLALALCAGAANGSYDASASTVLFAVIGSVLAGAIFGDHCSPISDTTILSSQASGCDHVAHVKTQMPYALCSAAFAILAGTLPVGFGWSPYLGLAGGAVGLVLTLWLLGRRNDREEETEG
ncbi:MAG TPA: Na+/H+ antiporter NhaC family protein [Pirellulaceae bacterium]|jgi:Na+/H+ antiporter NhaC|nr:Na+/H+ antiporter NhaC family protein [Pirellulaceae bacterium]